MRRRVSFSEEYLSISYRDKDKKELGHVTYSLVEGRFTIQIKPKDMSPLKWIYELIWMLKEAARIVRFSEKDVQPVNIEENET